MLHIESKFNMDKKLFYIVGFLFGVFVSTLNAQNNNYEVTILNNGEEVDLTGIKFGVISGKGLYAMLGNTLVSMDDERSEYVDEFSLPDSTIIIEDMVILPNMFVCKYDSSIYYLNKRNNLRGFSIDTDNFSIHYASDSTIFILVGDKVFESNPRKGKPMLKFKYAAQKIIKYMPMCHDEAYVVTENELLIQTQQGLQSLLCMPETITAVNISSHGIFIGTPTKLFKYNDINTLQLIDTLPIAQILNDGEYIYIITTDSTIYRLQRLSEQNKTDMANGI